MYHNQDQICNAHYEIGQDPVDLSSRLAAPPKPRRKPQSAAERTELIAEIQGARSIAAHAEAGAGPTLQKEIDEEKALERVCDGARLRTEVTGLLLMQRAGLCNLCNHESSGEDYFYPTARVRLYFEAMLALSANVAALSGSGWSSASGWFRDRLPLPYDRIGRDVLESRFNTLLAEATAKIASRPTIRVWDLRTAPSAKELAETFGTTMAALRAADANRCRLTAIDAQPKRERDRVDKAEKRLAAGMTPQAERNVRERDIELAALADCTDRWIRELRLNGKLAAYLARKGLDVPEASTDCDPDDSSQKWRST